MTFTVTAAIWLIVTQWISAGLGGYIAGRLRTRWIGTHTHEVFFRDTAHGLVTWAVATVVVAAIAGSSLVSMIGGSVHAVTGAASGVATAGAQSMMPTASSSARPPMASYGTDKLFRSADPTAAARGADDPRAEAGRILANAIATGDVPDGDRTYLAGLVAARTGVSQQDAQKRVDEWIAGSMAAEAKVKEAADEARKTAAEAAIYTALSLLLGAFIGSVSAALGGRLRDEHP
jgi:hypothetical protein